MKHRGMITNVEELTVGRKLWHIYGHLNRQAEAYVIASEVKTSELSGFRYVLVKVPGLAGEAYETEMFLGDVGIGTDHNMNRLFRTEKQALAFYDSGECTAYRVRARAEDSLLDDIDYYYYEDMEDVR